MKHIASLSPVSFRFPNAAILAAVMAFGAIAESRAADREGGLRPGVRREGDAGPRPGAPREGDGQIRRGPRDGEGPARRGPRDGEGVRRMGPRDGEGGVRRGEGDGAARQLPGIVIRLNAQGQVLSGDNKAVPVETVRSTLKRIAGGQKGRSVIVTAPKEASFGNVVAFVNECEKAGVTNIRFVAN